MIVVILIGLVLLAFGAYLTWLHIYCVFLRYPLHLLRGGTRDNFRYVSGVPLIGAFFVVLASIAFHRVPALAYTAIAIAGLDFAALLLYVPLLVRTLLFSRRTPDAE